MILKLKNVCIPTLLFNRLSNHVTKTFNFWMFVSYFTIAPKRYFIFFKKSLPKLVINCLFLINANNINKQELFMHFFLNTSHDCNTE